MRVKKWVKILALSALAAPALTACTDLEALMKPRTVLLAGIERDLYKALLASDKIEKLRTTPSKSAKPVKTKIISDKAKKPVKKKIAKEPEKSDEIIYLSQTEITPVNMKFQGDAKSFFGKIAKDIKYKIIETGKPRDVDLNIDAKNEPMIGLAIRAANLVEGDMKVRMDMEEKIIRIEYIE